MALRLRLSLRRVLRLSTELSWKGTCAHTPLCRFTRVETEAWRLLTNVSILLSSSRGRCGGRVRLNGVNGFRDRVHGTGTAHTWRNSVILQIKYLFSNREISPLSYEEVVVVMLWARLALTASDQSLILTIKVNSHMRRHHQRISRTSCQTQVQIDCNDGVVYSINNLSLWHIHIVHFQVYNSESQSLTELWNELYNFCVHDNAHQAKVNKNYCAKKKLMTRCIPLSAAVLHAITQSAL